MLCTSLLFTSISVVFLEFEAFGLAKITFRAMIFCNIFIINFCDDLLTGNDWQMFQLKHKMFFFCFRYIFRQDQTFLWLFVQLSVCYFLESFCCFTSQKFHITGAQCTFIVKKQHYPIPARIHAKYFQLNPLKTTVLDCFETQFMYSVTQKAQQV